MSPPGDSLDSFDSHDSIDGLDPVDRLTTLAIFEHECRVAADRSMVLDELLTRLDVALGGPPGTTPSSDDAAALAQPEPLDDGGFERVSRQRLYREAVRPLATLAGPVTRSLADFLG